VYLLARRQLCIVLPTGMHNNQVKLIFQPQCGVAMSAQPLPIMLVVNNLLTFSLESVTELCAKAGMLHGGVSSQLPGW